MSTTLNRDTDSAVELHRILTACLTRRYGLVELAASALADEIVLEIRREVGGGEIYVPCPDRRERNREIVREYNGTNIPELAKRYGLSERHVARIVASTALR